MPSEALKVNCMLNELNVGYNSTGDEGETTLSEALKVNCKLKDLGLIRNSVGDEGVAALAEALKINCTLKVDSVLRGTSFHHAQQGEKAGGARFAKTRHAGAKEDAD